MLGILARFVASGLVLLLIDWLPGIRVGGYPGIVLAALTITVLGFVVEKVLGRGVTSRSRGAVGFVTSATVIYLAKFFAPQYLSATLVAAVLAAIAIGIIDSFVPARIR